MSITASELIALVSVSGAKEAVGQLLGVGAASDDAGTKLRNLTVAGTLIAGAALVGVGAKAVEMAGNFQQATGTLVTSAGLSRDSIGAVRQGILDLSVSTATSTDQLAKGMFNVQSALHLGAGGLQVLKAAAEGARAENSDLAQTTDVLTTAMVNYHIAAAQAVPTMNSLIVTVADGKMHMDDLTGSLKNVLPVSAAFHIKLSDVEGALATMANAGDRGTAAGTHLAMMFKMLSSPTGAASKEMKAMGLDSIKLAQTMQTSLPDALKMIQDAVSKHFTPGSVEYNRAIQAILGGSKSGVAGLEIFNQGLKTLGNNTNDAATALRKGGKDVENWDIIQGNFNFKLDAAKNAVSALMIGIGTTLLPVISHLLDVITPAITAFSGWATSGHAISDVMNFISQHAQTMVPLLAGAGAIIGGLLVAAFYSLAVAAGSAAVAVIAATWPFLLIGAAVAGLAAIFMHFYQTNAPFKAFIDNLVGGLKQAWSVIVANFIPAMQAVGAAIQTYVLPILSQIGAFLVSTFVPALQQAGNWLQQMGGAIASHVLPVLQQLGSFVASNFVPIMTMIGTAIASHVMPFLNQLGSFIAADFVPVWHQLVTMFQSQLMPLFGQLGGVVAMLARDFNTLVAFIAPLIAESGGLVGILKKIWDIIGPILIPMLIALGVVIGVVLAGALGMLVGMLSGLAAGLAMFLRGVIMVIGGVAQVITGFVQIISGIVSLIVDIFTGKWGNVASDLGMIWQGIVNLGQGFLQILYGLFVATLGAIAAYVWGFITGIIGFFTTLYNELVGHSIIPDMVNGILNWFTNLVNEGIAFITHLVVMILMWMVKMEVMVLVTVTEMVHIFLSWLDNLTGGAVTRAQSVVSGITGILGSLPGRALQWGLDMVNGFIQGIKNAAGGVANAVGGIVNTVAGLLHHSKPDYGPLANDDQWMPDMMNMFASGIESGVPKIQAALSKVTKPLSVNLNPSSSGFAGGNLQLPSLVGASSGNHSFSIPIYIGADEVAEYMVDPVMGRATRKTRLKHGRRTY